jgi:hypothetical protein
MRVQYGMPYLPRLSLNVQKFRTDLRRIFHGITDPDIDRLVDLVTAAEQGPHGTLLIISEAAAAEAERPKTQGTPIQPFQLTAEMLGHLTPIDGAVILDPRAECYAIGTILDGIATENGIPDEELVLTLPLGTTNRQRCRALQLLYRTTVGST